jgi:uncharacterized protein (TIGR00730 family)
MNTVAATFREHGGKIYGYSLKVFEHETHKSADEMVIFKELGSRKAAMLDRSDVVITLPGGIGTLDEVTEVVELRKQKHHDKPIIVLDTDGFYDGFKAQLKRISEEGFLPTKLEDLIVFVQTPAEALEYLSKI